MSTRGRTQKAKPVEEVVEEENYEDDESMAEDEEMRSMDECMDESEGEGSDEENEEDDSQEAPPPPSKKGPPAKGSGGGFKSASSTGKKSTLQTLSKKTKPPKSKYDATKTTVSGGIKKKSANIRKFDRYIFRIMKTVDPNFRIGRKGMDIANTFLLDIIDRLASESAALSKRSGKSGLGWRDACCAAMLTLPGELAKMGIAEGQRAMSHYARSMEAAA